MLPSSIMTFISLTQQPSTPLSVLVARATAWLMASSKLVSEIALNSVTRATLIRICASLQSCCFSNMWPEGADAKHKEAGAPRTPPYQKRLLEIGSNWGSIGEVSVMFSLEGTHKDRSPVGPRPYLLIISSGAG